MFVCFSDIEVACTKYEGVDAVKRALRKGLELSTEAMPIKVCTVQLSSILLHFLFRLYTHVMTKCYFIFLAVHNSVLSIKECNTHTQYSTASGDPCELSPSCSSFPPAYTCSNQVLFQLYYCTQFSPLDQHSTEAITHTHSTVQLSCFSFPPVYTCSNQVLLQLCSFTQFCPLDQLSVEAQKSILRLCSNIL